MIQVQRESNRSIELLMGTWSAPDSLIKKTVFSFLLTYFSKKVDDTVRIAAQLPK